MFFIFNPTVFVVYFCKGDTPPASQQPFNPPAEPQPSTSTAAESGGESSAPKNLEPPPPPKDVSEALQQRLEKYQHATNQAKQEGNSSKARRMGRIVKVSCSLGSTLLFPSGWLPQNQTTVYLLLLFIL